MDSSSEFPGIKVVVSVRNPEGTPAPALNEDNFMVYEDGYRVNYVRVKKLAETDGFLYIVFSVDSSKSISAEYLRKIKCEAYSILSSSSSNDLIAIYRFNDKVELLNNFTGNKEELLRSINKIERHGTKTMLFDAIYSSIRLLNLSGAERKAVIVFSDGKDEGSSIEAEDIIRQAVEAGVPVYSISMNSTVYTRVLSRISKLTGGLQFNLGDRDIGDVYRSIMNMINGQYVVNYKSMLEPDQKVHKLEVRLSYGAIKDREQVELTVKKKFDVIHMPTLPEFLLISLILILVLIMIVFFLFTLRKINQLIASPVYRKTAVSPPPPREDVNKSAGAAVRPEIIPEENGSGLVYSKTWLVERDGKDSGKKIPVSGEEFIIGSDSKNSIEVKDKNVSPKHAKIKRVKNAYYLFDLASENGTYLNENKLLRPKLLYDWDEIRVGKKIFIFRGSNIA